MAAAGAVQCTWDPFGLVREVGSQASRGRDMRDACFFSWQNQSPVKAGEV